MWGWGEGALEMGEANGAENPPSPSPSPPPPPPTPHPGLGIRGSFSYMGNRETRSNVDFDWLLPFFLCGRQRKGKKRQRISFWIPPPPPPPLPLPPPLPPPPPPFPGKWFVLSQSTVRILKLLRTPGIDSTESISFEKSQTVELILGIIESI